MRFLCCFCCLKWEKNHLQSHVAKEICVLFGEMLFLFVIILFYIFFGCCCFMVFPNCYWSSWWSRKRQCRCIWRKTMLNGCVANSPASTVKPNLVFLADRVCRENNGSQKFRKSSLSWIFVLSTWVVKWLSAKDLICQPDCEFVVANNFHDVSSIHGHVIRTELQPKVLALQSCLWKQEVTPKSLEKCRLNS